MSNPLSNLIGKKYEDLTYVELLQCIDEYCEENKYDFDEEYRNEIRSRDMAIRYFESEFHYEFALEDFFNYWTI
jgi:hypothetical protein